MLEASSLQCVVQLDVDAEIVGIELQTIARAYAAVLVGAERERCYRAVE